jgi:hypothetical protein
MNEQQRAVIQQALEALNTAYIYDEDSADGYYLKAIEALRQLLEQPEPVQEPVAWMQSDEVHISLWKDDYHTIPLYTTPPAQPAVPLTDEQANLLINGRGDEGDDDYVEPTGDGFYLTDEDLVKLIRRVEAHHGIEVKP